MMCVYIVKILIHLAELLRMPNKQKPNHRRCSQKTLNSQLTEELHRGCLMGRNIFTLHPPLLPSRFFFQVPACVFTF